MPTDDDSGWFKVGYQSKAGYGSTAYVRFVSDDVAVGSNKYTDDPVALKWNGEEWIEE